MSTTPGVINVTTKVPATTITVTVYGDSNVDGYSNGGKGNDDGNNEFSTFLIVRCRQIVRLVNLSQSLSALPWNVIVNM